MSSYEHSRFVVSRKRYHCGDCGDVIEKGQRYLAFMKGLTHKVPICARCSLRVTDDGQPLWYCAATKGPIERGSL